MFTFVYWYYHWIQNIVHGVSTTWNPRFFPLKTVSYSPQHLGYHIIFNRKPFIKKNGKFVLTKNSDKYKKNMVKNENLSYMLLGFVDLSSVRSCSIQLRAIARLMHNLLCWIEMEKFKITLLKLLPQLPGHKELSEQATVWLDIYRKVTRASRRHSIVSLKASSG